MKKNCAPVAFFTYIRFKKLQRIINKLKKKGSLITKFDPMINKNSMPSFGKYDIIMFCVNHKKIKEALEEFCIQETKTNTRQRDATRALLRYQTLEFDLVLLLKFIRKVSFVNFIFGFLSYINSKLIICWIK